MKRTCAIVQFEGVHEEVTPSLIHALNKNDIKPELYINKKCIDTRGDIFAELDDIDYSLNYVSIAGRKDWQSIINSIKMNGNSFVLLSTYQTENVGSWAGKVGLPIVGLVHNVRRFMTSEACTTAFKNGQTKALCLAPHVASYMNQRMPLNLIDSVGVVQSIYWGEAAARPEGRRQGRRTVAIPGGVSFRTRDFEGLVNALAAYKDKFSGQKNDITLEFLVLGGGKDRAALEQLAATKNVEKQFRFAPLGPKGRVLYKDYVAGLRQSDLLLPLNPLNFIPYREHKITSAIPTAIGFGLPVVLDRWTERVYQIPAVETDANMSACLEAIMALSDAELAAKQAEVARIRIDILNRNAKEMARILSLLPQS